MAKMTHSEVFTEIENRLGDLKFKDYWGNDIPGAELLGVLAGEDGWEELANKLMAYEITPEEYLQGCSVYIDRMARAYLVKKIDSKLKFFRGMSGSGESNPGAG